MKLCFFTKHEITWGSSRERVGLYLDLFKRKGHEVTLIYSIPNNLTKVWISGRKKSLFDKIYSFWHSRILKHLKTIWLIIIAGRFDIILVQKVNLYYGLVKLLCLRNKNLIFDFDDQCFWNLGLTRKRKSGTLKKFEFWRKGIQDREILKLYTHVIAGNSHLANIAKRVKKQNDITVIPTSIDCKFYSTKKKTDADQSGPIVIGWSGSGENHLRHLKMLIEPLESLSKNHEFTFKLIGAAYSKKIRALFDFLGDKFECIEWVEIKELPKIIRSFDIGLMPLKDDEESRAKCGFKALKYMASGVPTVASSVGVNSEIITDGVNGFLINRQSEWVKKLPILLKDKKLREKFSVEGRKTVEDSYSLTKTSQSFIDLLENIHKERV